MGVSLRDDLFHVSQRGTAVPATAPRKARHPAGEMYRRGPCGFLLSRMTRPPVLVAPTSTQSPCCPEYEDFRKGPMSSGVTTHRP